MFVSIRIYQHYACWRPVDTRPYTETTWIYVIDAPTSLRVCWKKIYLFSFSTRAEKTSVEMVALTLPLLAGRLWLIVSGND